MSDSYDQEFFDEQKQGGRRSANEIVPSVLRLVQARSVVDVGCGVGAWLSVFKEHGIADVLGIDAEWAEGHNQLLPQEFIKRDLTKPISLDRTFDLVVCLEVAEHLPEACAGDFIRSLVSLGPVVLFSAAIPLQGGVFHLNEQWPDYWARLFQEHNYVPVDCLRGELWSNELVDWWYAQNALLFVERMYLDSSLLLPRESRVPLGQLSLVHPRNYMEKARRANLGLTDVIRMIPSLAMAAVARRVRRLKGKGKA